MFTQDMTIAGFDDELAAAIAGEVRRQEEHIELIASENYASPRVLEAQGSVLTNKYAEGYPAKRYYGGCEFVDQAEQLAIERARQLFGADYVNVQPHSGSQANAAVYLALCQPGDTILGMSLADGGHLTHGSKVNFSGKTFKAVQYGVHPDTGELDYEQMEALAREHKPTMLVAGFSAYSRVVDWARCRAIADAVGAYLFVDMAHVAGLIATGHYPSPVQIADVTTTTTHKTLRGPRGGLILANADDLNTGAVVRVDREPTPGTIHRFEPPSLTFSPVAVPETMLDKELFHEIEAIRVEKAEQQIPGKTSNYQDECSGNKPVSLEQQRRLADRNQIDECGGYRE